MRTRSGRDGAEDVNNPESSSNPDARKHRKRFDGSDTRGRRYDNQEDMWKVELANDDKTPYKRSDLPWYQKGKEYWAKVEPTVDGMLGGLGILSDLDVKSSKTFLHALKGVNFNGVVLDVGAGIGRVSKELLLPLFDRVDLVESNAQYIEASYEHVIDSHLERRFCCGMEDFTPEPNRCANALLPGGLICIKENICDKGFVVDKDDSSLTRSDQYLRTLFTEANLEIVHCKTQSGFPENLFPVKMYALRKSPHRPE